MRWANNEPGRPSLLDALRVEAGLFRSHADEPPAAHESPQKPEAIAHIPPSVDDDWKRSTAVLSDDQKQLAIALREATVGLTHTEMLLVESAFPEGANTSAAARMKKQRIIEAWDQMRPRSKWAIKETGKLGRETRYKAEKKSEV